MVHTDLIYFSLTDSLKKKKKGYVVRKAPNLDNTVSIAGYDLVCLISNSREHYTEVHKTFHASIGPRDKL